MLNASRNALSMCHWAVLTAVEPIVRCCFWFVQSPGGEGLLCFAAGPCWTRAMLQPQPQGLRAQVQGSSGCCDCCCCCCCRLFREPEQTLCEGRLQKGFQPQPNRQGSVGMDVALSAYSPHGDSTNVSRWCSASSVLGARRESYGILA